MAYIDSALPPVGGGQRKSRWIMLHSGGNDSAVLLHYMVSNGLAVRCLFVNYGQTAARAEYEAVMKTCAHIGETTGVRIPYTTWTAPLNALTLKGVVESRNQPPPFEEIEAEEEWRRINGEQLTLPTEQNMSGVPLSPDYTPGRNAFLIGAASILADTVAARGVAAAIVCDQPETFPDTRPTFYYTMASMFTEQDLYVDIWTPFIYESKQRVIQIGKDLGVPYDLTMSCYTPTEDGEHCNECHSCHGRQAAMAPQLSLVE